VADQSPLFLAEAALEVEHAFEYYLEQGGQGLAERFLVQMHSTLGLIEQHPELGAPTHHGLRQIRLKRFPFGVIYGVRNDQIVIIAVAHHRRRPGYWMKRQA
jgi:toxin ParE1/3/4